jgi:hypothetical protein
MVSESVFWGDRCVLQLTRHGSGLMSDRCDVRGDLQPLHCAVRLKKVSGAQSVMVRQLNRFAISISRKETHLFRVQLSFVEDIE